MTQFAYLAAMGAIEEQYVPDGAVKDDQIDALHDLVTRRPVKYFSHHA